MALLFNNRYQIRRPLRSDSHPYNEVHEIEDLQARSPYRFQAAPASQTAPDAQAASDPQAAPDSQAQRARVQVLKLLKDQRPEIIAYFDQEWRILTQLDHPGIPKAYDHFEVATAGGDLLRCLVMEKIPGQNLEQYMQQRLDQGEGPISPDQALVWLRQITEILVYLHGQRHFHRDIKPSNIILRPDGQLVLIDFGTAREFTAHRVGNHTVTVISSPGYTAPEQLNGRAVPQSDLFALGQTWVYLLTGLSPHRTPLPWHQGLTPSPLLRTLDQLIALDPQARPASPLALKDQLGPGGWRHLKFWARWGAAGLGLTLLMAGSILAWQRSQPATCTLDLGDRLSCGEEVLLPPGTLLPQTPTEKQQGAEAFGRGDYPRAEQLFKVAWQKSQDPETLIYLNNARFEQRQKDSHNSNQPTYTVAVVAPVDRTPDPDTSLTGVEILRGVAQWQDELMQTNIQVRVVIGNDENQKDAASALASTLTQRQDILAVIGHYTSEITLQVVDRYQKARMPLLAPTSTSAQLSQQSDKYPGNNFFFRTPPSTVQASEALADYLHLKLQRPKVAIFYNPNFEFSRSLHDEFVKAVKSRQGEIVYTAELEGKTFSDETHMEQAIAAQAQVLAIFPSGRTNPYAFTNAIKLIRANQQRLPVLGNNTLDDPQTLEDLSRDPVGNLVVVTGWHPLQPPPFNNPDFNKAAKQIWKGQVSWRTVMAYDVGKSLGQAFENLRQRSPSSPPSREDLRQALADPEFAAVGASGPIHFDGSDRRENTTLLVKLIPRCESDKIAFVPETFPDECLR
jgi:eukaryotic-like serine/threonine-protein kinase